MTAIVEGLTAADLRAAAESVDGEMWRDVDELGDIRSDIEELKKAERELTRKLAARTTGKQWVVGKRYLARKTGVGVSVAGFAGAPPRERCGFAYDSQLFQLVTRLAGHSALGEQREGREASAELQALYWYMVERCPHWLEGGSWAVVRRHVDKTTNLGSPVARGPSNGR